MIQIVRCYSLAALYRLYHHMSQKKIFLYCIHILTIPIWVREKGIYDEKRTKCHFKQVESCIYACVHYCSSSNSFITCEHIVFSNSASLQCRRDAGQHRKLLILFLLKNKFSGLIRHYGSDPLFLGAFHVRIERFSLYDGGRRQKCKEQRRLEARAFAIRPMASIHYDILPSFGSYSESYDGSRNKTLTFSLPNTNVVLEFLLHFRIRRLLIWRDLKKSVKEWGGNRIYS